MSYVSEELNNGYYQDNNDYSEIGELHASSENPVVGRIDSRYSSTKKVSLLSPDSDRLIYSYYSDARISDMAIREEDESLKRKMIFVGKNFLTVYDVETGNFVLKDPKHSLTQLMNPWANVIAPGLGALTISDAEKVTNDTSNYLSLVDFESICENFKYVLNVDTYFLIVSQLSNGKYVIFRLNPDNLTLAKFRPVDFYSGPGAEKLVFKPFLSGNILCIFTKDSSNKLKLWTTDITDSKGFSSTVVSSSSGLTTLGILTDGKYSIIKEDDIVKIFDISSGSMVAHGFKVIDGVITGGFKYTVTDNGLTSYTSRTISKGLAIDTDSTSAHVFLILDNGNLKVADDGYSQGIITFHTNIPTNGIKNILVNFNSNFKSSSLYSDTVIRLYDTNNKVGIYYDDPNTSSNELTGTFYTSSAKTGLNGTTFTDTDDLINNYNGSAVFDYLLDGKHTIVYGYYTENGLIKPLIKDIYDKNVAYTVTTKTDKQKEVLRPFNNGLEPDSGIDIVKDVGFGKTKIARVRLNPSISKTASTTEDLFMRESDTDTSEFTEGSTLWTALKNSGIPYNTHVRTVGRIILDGYDIPIENTLITPPDSETDKFGSVLLTFSKNFDINTINSSYTKLGDVLYPGILFRHNQGFLSDALISNIYSIDGGFAYQDANNGKLFEDTISLTIKASVVIDTSDSKILVIGASHGKIASINISTGSYITSEGTSYGDSAPEISSSKITNYSFDTDGEIVTIVKGFDDTLSILYNSGKIIRYNTSNNACTVSDTIKNTSTEGTVFGRKDNVLIFKPANSTKIYGYDADAGFDAKLGIYTGTTSNFLNIGNDFYYSNGSNLYKLNVISRRSAIIKTSLGLSGKVYLAYDYNDRIYIAAGSTIKYYSISKNTINNFSSNKITPTGFLVYWNNLLVTISGGNIVGLDDEANTKFTNTTKISITDFISFGSYVADNKLHISIFTKATIHNAVIDTSNNVTYTSSAKTIDANASIIMNGAYPIYLTGTTTATEINSVIGKVADGNSIPSSSTDKFIGFANNILYFDRNGSLYAKDLRKTHLNYINPLVELEVQTNLRTAASSDTTVTGLGFADGGNVLVIAWDDGSIESAYLPEYNSADGYYKSTYGDTVESYVRTVYVENKVSSNTTLGALSTPTKTGYSFIGWSFDKTENNMIPVESKAALSSTSVSSGTTVYAVFKDNTEEYTDRCATRLYAKAGEYLTTGVYKIEELDDDTYFYTTTKTLRWSNVVGAFFEGNDSLFTGKSTERHRGIYNYNKLQGIFLNEAGTAQVGKYIFYFGGYNPLDENPVTTVHNAIVIYDTQNNDYAIMSRGTDNLHGTILSRIRSFGYYYNGYIYLFGGLERKDIHTTDGNNYSKFYRSRDIERMDLRSGEFAILEAKYGSSPETMKDVDSNGDLTYKDTGLAYRYSMNYSYTNNTPVLDGLIKHEIDSSFDRVTFDLTTEEATTTRDTSITSTTFWEGFDTPDKKYQFRWFDSSLLVRKCENISSSDNFTFTSAPTSGVAYLKGYGTINNKLIAIIEFEDSTGKAKEYSVDFAAKTVTLLREFYDTPYSKSYVSINPTYLVGDNEFFITEEDELIKDRNSYRYNYKKRIFNNEAIVTELDDDRSWIHKDNSKFVFKNNIEYIFTLPSKTKLRITKVDSNLEETYVDVKVASTTLDQIVPVVQDDDVITILLKKSGNLTGLVSYLTDQDIAITRKVNLSETNLTVRNNAKYVDEIKAIVFGSSSNRLGIITNVSATNANNDDQVQVKANSVNTTVQGFSIRKDRIQTYFIDSDKLQINEYELNDDLTEIGSSEFENDSKNFTLDNEVYDIINLDNGKLLVKFANSGLIIDGSSVMSKINDISIINSSAIPYDVNEDGLYYLYNSHRYLLHTSTSFDQNPSNVLKLDSPVNNTNNTYITENKDYVYVLSDSDIYKINKLSRSITKYISGTSGDILSTHVYNGIGVSNDILFLVDITNKKLVMFNTLTYESKAIDLTSTVSSTLNNNVSVNFAAVEDSIYFNINAVILKYDITNDVLSDYAYNACSSSETIVSLKYIKKYNALYFSAVSDNGTHASIYSKNLTSSRLTTLATWQIGTMMSPTADYTNIKNLYLYPALNLDPHGNGYIIGGNTTNYDADFSHITYIDGTSYDETDEIAGVGLKNYALRSVIDDSNIYTVDVDTDGHADVIITPRTHIENVGSTQDINDGDAISSQKLFTYNNELYGFDIFGKSKRIVKYNYDTKTFETYSDTLDSVKTFVSAKAFTDGTVYIVSVYYSGIYIYANVVCYNLNTKKIISDVTEQVFDNTTNVGTVDPIYHSTWKGKYLITVINAYRSSVLLVLDVTKPSDITVRAESYNTKYTGNIEYFNNTEYLSGATDVVNTKNLLDTEFNKTAVSGANEYSALIRSGNRLLLTATSDTKENFNTSFKSSDTKILTNDKTEFNSYVVPIEDNAILIGHYTNETNPIYDIENRNKVVDLLKTPVTTIDHGNNVGIRIYSGSTKDLIVTFNYTNNEIIDSLEVYKDYGISINTVTKITDTNFLVTYDDTPNVSTLIVSADGYITFERYDGKIFGKSINVGTNIHTIQEVDLTMLFDDEMNEYDFRKSN